MGGAGLQPRSSMGLVHEADAVQPVGLWYPADWALHWSRNVAEKEEWHG